jgi:8-amino-3,8-dideoxy-alpha-D-manno-octulosonate transaminase
MPRALFEKIVEDLAAINFSRTLSFHFYNEPLMDERLPALVAHARKRLPRCVFDLSSNGDYLTPALTEALFEAGLDSIHVSLHSARAEKHVRSVLSRVDDASRARVNVVSMFDREEKGEFLYNRIEMAEALPRSVPTLSIGAGCSNVDSLMINFSGESALCCNDFFATNGHGDLSEVSVETLWRESRPVRKRIYLGQFDKPICRICNVGALDP